MNADPNSDIESRASETEEVFNQRELPQDVLDALGAGRFANIEYISSGATSSVFSALDRNLDKRVAIKLLSNADEHRLMNFQHEAKTACKLDHRNLVATLNFGITSKNHAYLIMDFVEGVEFEDLIEEHGPLKFDTALPIFLQICEGMIHSHSKKIAHRDLKTSNIIIQNFGTDGVNAVVVDFGLARERKTQDKTRQGSSSGKLRGTPRFISPEQAKGLHGDERSDIYSFGCIIFRAITGKYVFESDDLFELLRQHIEDNPPRLTDAAPHLHFDPLLQPLLDQMLEKDPTERFQSIKEVKEALLEIQRQRMAQPAAGQTPLVRIAHTPVKRRRRSKLILPVVIGALLVVSALGLITYQLLEGKPAETIKVETKAEKLDRLFRFENAVFMSHLDWDQLAAKDAGSLTDADLEVFDGQALPTSNINLSFASNITGEGLKYLAHIPNLCLELNYTNLQPIGYETLASLNNLHAVTLASTNVSAKEMRLLSRLPKLMELGLDTNRNLNDEMMEEVSRIKSLLVLVARDKKSKVTDKGASCLTNCTNLVTVQLDGADLTDAGIEPLFTLPNLIDVRLNRCEKLTGKTLKAITDALPNLQLIGFGATNTQPEDLACLEKCKRLSFIEIPGVLIGDAQMKVFGDLPELKYLYIGEVKCSAEGIAHLYKLKNMRKIYILSIDAPEEAIDELRKRWQGCMFMTPGNKPKNGDNVEDYLEMIQPQ
ncbi:protein kinase [Candidatus Obscuribacterales bacterium]|nr:protein kinase [Candidatus Obscuribacterales bacterium]